jgi:hypothetical protein
LWSRHLKIQGLNAGQKHTNLLWLAGASDEERFEALHWVCEKRKELLITLNINTSSYAAEALSGKVLAYAPDWSLSEGASEAASNRFFDADDVPAWDTWLLYVQENEMTNEPEDWNKYLLTWVPEKYLELVQFGIEVNSTACLEWASNLSTPFIRELREAKIIN